MNKKYYIAILLLIILYCITNTHEGLENLGKSMLPDTAKHNETAYLDPEAKKEIAAEAERLWDKMKKVRMKSGGGGMAILEEGAMKEFLKRLNTPGLDIPAPGGDTEKQYRDLLKKGPPPLRGPPLEYNDDKSVPRGGGAGPGNKWTPPLNPKKKQIERGHFFKIVWECAYAADDFKRKCKKNHLAHIKWQSKMGQAAGIVLAAPGIDAACCCPAPCFAGTIAAISTCAGLAGSWFDPRGWTWMCMTAAEYSISKHRLAVKRFSDWVSQKKKFGCWEKKTSTELPYPSPENVFRRVPHPKIDTGKHDQKYGPRYISGAITDRIDVLMPLAMSAAFAAKVAVGIAHKATIVAIVATKIATAAYILEPAANALVNIATQLWKTADKTCNKHKDVTFDLAHEVLMFERGRIAACSLPGIKANDPRMVKYLMAIKPPPAWLKFDDFLRGKGHHPLKDEKGEQMS